MGVCWEEGVTKKVGEKDGLLFLDVDQIRLQCLATRAG